MLYPLSYGRVERSIASAGRHWESAAAWAGRVPCQPPKRRTSRGGQDGPRARWNDGSPATARDTGVPPMRGARVGAGRSGPVDLADCDRQLRARVTGKPPSARHIAWTPDQVHCPVPRRTDARGRCRGVGPVPDHDLETSGSSGDAQLADEPALADARLAQDEGDLPITADGTLEHRSELAQLVVAPDDRVIPRISGRARDASLPEGAGRHAPGGWSSGRDA